VTRSRTFPKTAGGAWGVPLGQIIATRNRPIHAYLGIDDDTLWSIIQDDIPPLLKTLHELQLQLELDGAIA
jgi:uncharacterized protein with HEPN domain